MFLKNEKKKNHSMILWLLSRKSLLLASWITIKCWHISWTNQDEWNT